MRIVLFICTGNIFRSLIAERAFRTWLGDNREVEAASAGLRALPQEMRPAVRERLRERGIDPSGHRQRKLTEGVLREADLAVAMGENHHRCLRAFYRRDSFLFNELAYGSPTGIPDVEEIIPGWEEKPAEVEEYCRSVTDHICRGIPAFGERALRLLDPAALEIGASSC